MKKIMIIVLACVSMMANAQWVCENGQWHPLNMTSIGMYSGGGCVSTNRVSTSRRKGVISLSKGGNKGISLSNGGNRKLTLTTTKTRNRKRK